MSFLSCKLYYCIIVIFEIAHKTTSILEIDPDHESKYPNCGKYEKKASSRIANSEESTHIYPWVVHVDSWIGRCGGVIITNR